MASPLRLSGRRLVLNLRFFRARSGLLTVTSRFSSRDVGFADRGSATVRAEQAGPGVDLFEDDAVRGREVFCRPVRMRLFHELEPDRERRARSRFLRSDALLVVTADPDTHNETRRITDEPCVAKVVCRP